MLAELTTSLVLNNWAKYFSSFRTSAVRNEVVQVFTVNPVSILRKSISGRHRPVRVADGPMTARCRFT